MRKLTIDVVRERFAIEGCVLLADVYRSNTQPLSYVCCCGNESTTTWARFRIGRRCGTCGVARSNAKKRGYTIEQVHQEFGNRDMVCLEDEYVNNYTHMRYICSCGNQSQIRMFCLLKGQKCDKCDSVRGQTHYKWIADREEALFRRRFSGRMGSLVRSTLKALGVSKKFKSADIVGYTPAELRRHICSCPDWPDIAEGKWHIDHIFPIKAFLDYGIKDTKIINCLANLRPLRAFDNMSKNGRYDRAEFEDWLRKRGEEKCHRIGCNCMV